MYRSIKFMAHSKDGEQKGQNLLTEIKAMSLTQIMALRVLLADESPTIKKVFQLALQDFAVDVTSVAMGLDVANVARQFKPDIVFCDILLQKRNGYEVCAELKNDDQLKSLPVILMWSSFMELDQDKTQAARADGNLQKPFEVQDLRQIVNQFVAKTRQQRLGNFLNFPKMPDMVENPAATEPPPPLNKDWSMDSFDPIPMAPALEDNLESFQEVPLPPSPKVDELVADIEDEQEATQWSTKALNRFQVQPGSNEMAISLPEEEALPDVDLDMEASALPLSPVSTAAAASVEPNLMTEAQIEKMVREQAQQLIESIVWKVVPDLATQIIERELNRLLADKNP